MAKAPPRQVLPSTQIMLAVLLLQKIVSAELAHEVALSFIHPCLLPSYVLGRRKLCHGEAHKKRTSRTLCRGTRAGSSIIIGRWRRSLFSARHFVPCFYCTFLDPSQAIGGMGHPSRKGKRDRTSPKIVPTKSYF